jgi:hypothetical protein
MKRIDAPQKVGLLRQLVSYRFEETSINNKKWGGDTGRVKGGVGRGGEKIRMNWGMGIGVVAVCLNEFYRKGINIGRVLLLLFLKSISRKNITYEMVYLDFYDYV